MSNTVNRRLKAALGQAAGLAGFYARAFRSMTTIVAFHRVNDRIPADGITCSSVKFRSFCEFFAKNFSVVPLSEQIAGIGAGRGTGGTLSITFDDGYLDNVEVAAPILMEYRLPATFFVTTGFIGSQFVPHWDQHLPIQPGWMSWSHVRSLASEGFDIGSHTDRHINIATEDLVTVRADLKRSRETLELELGVTPRLFAYPFGGREHITAPARELVREAGFICCASCHGGSNADQVNPFELNRIGIAEWFDSPNQFGFELLTGRA